MNTSELTARLTVDRSSALPVGRHVVELVVVDAAGNESPPDRRTVVARRA